MSQNLFAEAAKSHFSEIEAAYDAAIGRMKEKDLDRLRIFGNFSLLPDGGLLFQKEGRSLPFHGNVHNWAVLAYFIGQTFLPEKKDNQEEDLIPFIEPATPRLVEILNHAAVR